MNEHGAENLVYTPLGVKNGPAVWLENQSEAYLIAT